MLTHQAYFPPQKMAGDGDLGLPQTPNMSSPEFSPQTTINSVNPPLLWHKRHKDSTTSLSHGSTDHPHITEGLQYLKLCEDTLQELSLLLKLIQYISVIPMNTQFTRVLLPYHGDP